MEVFAILAALLFLALVLLGFFVLISTFTSRSRLSRLEANNQRLENEVFHLEQRVAQLTHDSAAGKTETAVGSEASPSADDLTAKRVDVRAPLAPRPAPLETTGPVPESTESPQPPFVTPPFVSPQLPPPEAPFSGTGETGEIGGPTGQTPPLGAAAGNVDSTQELPGLSGSSASSASSATSPVQTASTEVPPPTPPTPPTTIAASAKPIDWEQWLGIRGAAVLGGLVLALAGLFFVKYSIDAGWISPPIRVALALLSGTGCLVASEWLKKRYESTSNALAGAGLVLLYTGLWAAHVLYGLIGLGATYATMTLVTLAGALIAWRRRSQVVATMGLLGGLVTPAFLSSIRHEPLTVFAYVFLLGVGAQVLGYRRNWWPLRALAFAATVIYLGFWTAAGDLDDRLPLTLGLILVAALIFAARDLFQAGRGSTSASDGEPAATASSPGFELGVPALLAGVGFAAVVSVQSPAVVQHLVLYAGLLALLGAAAQTLALVQNRSILTIIATVAASLSLGLVVIRFGSSMSFGPMTLALSLLALSTYLPLEFVLRRRPKTDWQGPAMAAVISALTAVSAAWWVTSFSQPRLYVSWLVLSAVCLWIFLSLSSLPRWSRLAGFAGLGLGLGLATTLEVESGHPLVVALACGLVFGAANLLPLPERWKRPFDIGSFAVVALPLMAFGFGLGRDGLSALAMLSVLGICTLLMATSASRTASGRLYATTVLLVTLAITIRAFENLSQAPTAELRILLLGALGLATFLTFWPFATARRFANSRGAWFAAVAALPLASPALLSLLEEAGLEAWKGLFAVGLGLLSFGALLATRRLSDVAPQQARRAMVGFAAVALCFAAAAIPLQFDRQWITIGWALQGLAMIALWKRLDHPGLKYFGFGLFVAVTIRLLFNPEVLRYAAAPEGLFLNWISYTYLVPAIAMILALRMLRPFEVARGLPSESSLYSGGKPWLSTLIGAGSIGVVFAWINLLVANAFRPGTSLTWAEGHNAARDLTQSLAWTLFAVVLLSLGIATRSKGLRWASLIFLILTIAKVFLFDLGELEDLYRVGSLVGLAVALILVSLVYQRFVFRSEPDKSGEPREATGGDTES